MLFYLFSTIQYYTKKYIYIKLIISILLILIFYCSYEECFDVYRDIIKNTTDDYEDERETNLSAVVANMTIEGSVSLCCISLLFIRY